VDIRSIGSLLIRGSILRKSLSRYSPSPSSRRASIVPGHSPELNNAIKKSLFAVVGMQNQNSSDEDFGFQFRTVKPKKKGYLVRKSLQKKSGQIQKNKML
jgi:hypothetical protein